MKKSANKIVNDALEYLAEYQACVKDPKKPRNVQPAFWKPPPWNKFKININRVVFASQKAASVCVSWLEMRMVTLLVLLVRRFGPLLKL